MSETILPSLESQDQKTNFNVTNGGRALNAVWHTSLPAIQKIILLYLGSQLDFRGDFMEARKVTLSTLAERVGWKRTSLKAAIRSLEEAGYLEVYENFSQNVQMANSFKLTDKLFSDYAIKLQAIQRDKDKIKEPRLPRHVARGPQPTGEEPQPTGEEPQPTTDTPSSSSLHSSPSSSEKKRKSVPINGRRSRHSDAINREVGKVSQKNTTPLVEGLSLYIFKGDKTNYITKNAWVYGMIDRFGYDKMENFFQFVKTRVREPLAYRDRKVLENEIETFLGYSEQPQRGEPSDATDARRNEFH